MTDLHTASDLRTRLRELTRSLDGRHPGETHRVSELIEVPYPRPGESNWTVAGGVNGSGGNLGALLDGIARLKREMPIVAFDMDWSEIVDVQRRSDIRPDKSYRLAHVHTGQLSAMVELALVMGGEGVRVIIDSPKRGSLNYVQIVALSERDDWPRRRH